MKLFEIPVYSMDKTKFNEYFIDYLRKQAGENEDCLEQVKPINYPKGVWEYNQIIGYIQIHLDTDRNDICFVVYKHENKVYPVRNNKNYLRNIMLTGMHFRIIDLSNPDIVKKTREYLFSIKEQQFNNRYLDTEIFDNTVDFIDFQGLLEGKHGQTENAQ